MPTTLPPGIVKQQSLLLTPSTGDRRPVLDVPDGFSDLVDAADGTAMTGGDRPPPIALDDLAEPRFDDATREILSLMSAAGATVSLDAPSLMAQATADTGLDDFGPDDAAGRLDTLCRAMGDEAALNGAGVLAQSVLLTGLLKNRLLIQDLLTRHPEIRDEVIAAPIVICGLPRTGTTHLHNLLSADERLRFLPYWESLEPVLAVGERPAPGQADPRRARTAMGLDFLNAALPEFRRMHEMTVDHAHEEIQLLAIDISSMLFETVAPMPTWRDAYLARDQAPSYAYLRTVLQVLQWSRGGTRWVLKSPQHLEQFPTLLATFPDATFVVTHRDPVPVTVSMITMLAYTARLAQDRIDTVGIASYWVDRLQRMLRSCVDQRHLLPAARTIDVHFDEFMADDLAMVRRIHDVAGLAVDPVAETSMRAFVEAHPRGRFGGIEYDLGPFELDRDELRDTFSFYSERFGVRAED